MPNLQSSSHLLAKFRLLRKTNNLKLLQHTIRKERKNQRCGAQWGSLNCQANCSGSARVPTPGTAPCGQGQLQYPERGLVSPQYGAGTPRARGKKQKKEKKR